MSAFAPLAGAWRTSTVTRAFEAGGLLANTPQGLGTCRLNNG
jgi:hypothetical protein